MSKYTPEQKLLFRDLREYVMYCCKVTESDNINEIDKQQLYNIASQAAQLVATVNRLIGTLG